MWPDASWKFIAAPDLCEFFLEKRLLYTPTENEESAHWKVSLVYKPHSQADSNWLAKHSSLEFEALDCFLSCLKWRKWPVALNLTECWGWHQNSSSWLWSICQFSKFAAEKGWIKLREEHKITVFTPTKTIHVLSGLEPSHMKSTTSD